MLKSKNIFFIILTIILSILLLEFLNQMKPKHPDAGLNIEELVQKYGYSIEIHEVITEDGYILTLHRIPGKTKQSIPILFMHGFSQSAIDFVYLGPGKALSFLLADQGYDIWLGNARGTTWSRKHKTLDPDQDKKFWDYTLHEIGTYDTSAFVDYILELTGQENLHYVGFSQGTIVFFVLTSERPEYSSKVRLMSALAPSIFLGNPKSPALGVAIFFRKTMEALIDIFNIKEFLSNDGLIAAYLRRICNENSMFVELCLHHFFILHGYNSEGTNKTMLSLFYSTTPAGTSFTQMLHIIQLMESGEFRRYDFGIADNLKKYEQERPPSYDLSKVTTPVALYYASNDWSVNIENMDKVKKKLRNVVQSYKVPLEKFNHDDFIHSEIAVEAVYSSVIEEILKH